MHSSMSGPLKKAVGAVLLDTCSLIWLTIEPDRLSEPARQAIEASDRLIFSDVSVLEIGLKWQVGKLGLPSPPRTWVEEQAHTWSLSRLAISRRHLYRSSELAALHRDPFDRLLVAQAIEEGLDLATPDAQIHAYPVSTVW